MSGDRLIRIATAAVVCAVAGFAAVVSYSHIYDLGRAHGQDGSPARLLPLSVDGLILAASLVLLHEARNGRDAPRLARVMLWLGIGATVGTNIAYRAGFGLLGVVISAWSAVAFIGSVELVMMLVRRPRGPQPGQDARPPPVVPRDVEQAARAAYVASVAAGAPLGQRAIADRFGVSRRKAAQLVTAVTVQGDGSPVWYSGGKLAADLTWPKLTRRWQGPDAARPDTPPPLTTAERNAVWTTSPAPPTPPRTSASCPAPIPPLPPTPPGDTLHVTAAVLGSRTLREPASGQPAGRPSRRPVSRQRGPGR